MHAPDTPPVPLVYLSIGASVIPLAPRDKKPYLEILDGGTWAPFQSGRPSERVVLAWLDRGHDHNWGVVCGQVSDGLYCGDSDDRGFAEWILAHARDPLLRGACVVRSGSGKAHIWFRSDNKLLSGAWRIRGSQKMGDIRGDGNGAAGPSYMVVPPSIHPDTGQPYQFVAGSMRRLPTIANGEEFLADILRAYLNEHPGQGPVAVASNSKEILTLDDDERLRTLGEITALGLKRKIYDTLMVPGNQAPGTRHWRDMPPDSRSEIDYAVACELIRKKLSFEQIERIFAVSLVGGNCYRDKQRSNHGYGYLEYTYRKARAAVDAEAQASQRAAGTNFLVTNVVRERFDEDISIYHLTVECTKANGNVITAQVKLDDRSLQKREVVELAFGTQIQFVPEFRANQQARQFFGTFGQAVMDMAEANEVRQAADAYTRLGPLAGRVRDFLRRLPKSEPADQGYLDRLGWQADGLFYIVGIELMRMLRNEDRTFKNEDGPKLMGLLGTHHRMTHRWPDGQTTEILVLKLRP